MVGVVDTHGLTRAGANRFCARVWGAQDRAAIAELGKRDLWFMFVWLLDRSDADNDWVYERCREFEAGPDGYLDLWARIHFKSSLITLAATIQEIVRNPEVTIGIFSHNNKTARKFLGQIKVELEQNQRLRFAYPELMYDNPEKQSPRWSEERGIIVRRKGNPKEATVEAHGLVDGMPTGAHYDLRIYDDVVTQDSVTTPEQMAKTVEAWELSMFLGTALGRARYTGTRYHFNDAYRSMMDKKAVIPRIHPATKNGDPDGEPVLYSREYLANLRSSLGPFVFSAQMLLNPVADQAQGFKREWTANRWEPDTGETMTRIVLIDPANEKKRHSDFTAGWVIGLGADRNYYILDMFRDRVNLTERADLLFRWHREWRPFAVGYEKYGKDSDIQHYEDRMRRENYRFAITPLGGAVKKEDRIRALIPLFERGRIFLPESLPAMSDNRRVDLVERFIEDEMLAFPVGVHDDMLDGLARILDPELPVVWPRPVEEKRDSWKPDPSARWSGRTWMSV